MGQFLPPALQKNDPGIFASGLVVVESKLGSEGYEREARLQMIVPCAPRFRHLTLGADMPTCTSSSG
jgi:hypothetical protein